MKYRRLGRTGLQISEIAFGCGNVGGLMIRGAYAEQVQAVKEALALGYNYFDTAPQYGSGLSETNLGAVLDELKPGVFVATKVSVPPDAMADVKGAVLRSLESSLKRLRKDRIDVFPAAQQGGGNPWRHVRRLCSDT